MTQAKQSNQIAFRFLLTTRFGKVGISINVRALTLILALIKTAMVIAQLVQSG